MPVHGYTCNNLAIFFKYTQSPWYCVSETPPDFELRYNFIWENLIFVKKLF